MPLAKLLPFPRPSAADRTCGREFLPAALEIIETPASPASRGVALTICGFLAGAVAWACLGEVDIVATAQGRIVPTGRTKTIQPLEIGVVRAIHVEDGQAVKAGDLLIELDPTGTEAERERLAGDLLAAQLDVARLTALVEGDEEAFHPPRGADAVRTALQRHLVHAQLAEQAAKLAALDRQIAQKQAESRTAQAALGKLHAAIPLLQQRVATRKYLADKEFGSKLTWLVEQQDLVEHESEVVVLASRQEEVTQALAGLGETRRQTQAEFRRTALGELAQAERKVAGLRQELVKAEQRHGLQRLTAPVDGVVQQFQVHTVGGVVTPAQSLLVIVPADSRLEVEAMVQNKDIGFVETEQPVEIKIDAFPFTKYGLLHGTVLNLSQDAIRSERTAQEHASTGESVTAGPVPATGSGLFYAARVSLDRAEMMVEGKPVRLAPGMAVSAEIKTGSRRLIEYFLSPLLRHRQEVMRER